MKILDWRPRAERMFAAGPTGLQPAAGREPGAGARGQRGGFLARWWSRGMDAVLARRVAGRTDPDPAPLVVSVGNLALGGTGKTPVIMKLAEDLVRRQVPGCVLTRGFRSSLPGPLVVDPADNRAGDEARLMAARLRPLSWPVIQSRRRELGLRLAADLPEQPRVILLEDGHQTRRVGRHLDVLLIDTWTVAGPQDAPVVVPLAGPVLPFGPYRETERGARRAGVLLLETGRPVPRRGPDGQRVETFVRRLVVEPANDSARQISRERGGHELPPPGTAVAALSGIARPEKFEAGLSRVLEDDPPVLAVRLGDHQSYHPSRVAAVTAAMAEAGATALVTTEKDWVKLAELWPDRQPAWLARLDLEWGPDSGLVEQILGLLSPT